jgi:histidine decarboxylase
MGSRFRSIATKSLGYPISHKVFDTISMNNAGDPFSNTSFYKMNSHDDERELINFYGKEVLKLDRFWGYCASGSTEGILNGLWMARKRFPQHTSIYASKDSHYCVAKIADMLCMQIVTVPVIESTGGMDMDHLRVKMSGVKHAIVVLTMGTTVRNGYDSIQEFYEKVSYRLPNTTFHIHVDGAFGGAIYPFVKPEWLEYKIDTFNLSFHKFFGCPYPCALFVTTKSVKDEIEGVGCFGKEMIYLSDKDYTISCSRNGISVSLMKEYICSDRFKETNTKTILSCIENKEKLIDELKRNKIEFKSVEGMSLSVELMNLPIKLEEQLCPYGVSIRNKKKDTFDTHVYICNHVDDKLLEELVDVIKS